MSRSFTAFCLILCLAFATIFIATPSQGEQPIATSSPEETAIQMMAPSEEAVKRGLAYLAENQLPDGSYSNRGIGRNPAVVALSGMAFLSSGSAPGRGPYGKNIDRCIDFLIEHTQPSGFISVPNATSHGPMYGHGFATLFLAEAYGMSPRQDLRDKLTDAINLIVSAQNPEGGWRYQPVPRDADLSVTICQIMALRAARNSGIHVPAETVQRCEEYVRRCQNPDGGFGYMTTDRSSAFPRSAAGLVAFYSAGVYEGKEIDLALDYLKKKQPSPGNRNFSHFYYGQYYAVQGMWQAGGEHWENWFPDARDLMLSRQNADGSWPDGNGQAYATAMACVMLQVPNNMVPIFQR